MLSKSPLLLLSRMATSILQSEQFHNVRCHVLMCDEPNALQPANRAMEWFQQYNCLVCLLCYNIHALDNDNEEEELTNWIFAIVIFASCVAFSIGMEFFFGGILFFFLHFQKEPENVSCIC